MLTVSQARKIVLSMPEAVESAHHGHPDFRVGGRIFATLWPDRGIAVVKLSIPEQTLLLESAPETFLTNGWSKLGYTGVRLARVPAAQFRELVAASWRATAPKRLLGDGGAKAGRIPARRAQKRTSG
jgi:hypothetical protein